MKRFIKQSKLFQIDVFSKYQTYLCSFSEKQYKALYNQQMKKHKKIKNRFMLDNPLDEDNSQNTANIQMKAKKQLEQFSMEVQFDNLIDQSSQNYLRIRSSPKKNFSLRSTQACNDYHQNQLQKYSSKRKSVASRYMVAMNKTITEKILNPVLQDCSLKKLNLYTSLKPVQIHLGQTNANTSYKNPFNDFFEEQSHAFQVKQASLFKGKRFERNSQLKRIHRSKQSSWKLNQIHSQGFYRRPFSSRTQKNYYTFNDAIVANKKLTSPKMESEEHNKQKTKSKLVLKQVDPPKMLRPQFIRLIQKMKTKQKKAPHTGSEIQSSRFNTTTY